MNISPTIILLLFCITATLARSRIHPSKYLMSQLAKNNRVIGGQDAEAGFAPYQVSLQDNDYHICGGAILDNQWILTAAHCVDNTNPKKLRVITGTVKWKEPGAVYYPDEYYVHGGYEVPDRDSYANDIALLHLNDTIKFDEFTQPVQLLSVPPQNGDDLILTGWGSTELWGAAPDTLQKITLKYLSHEDCLKDLGPGFADMKDPSHICTYTQIGEGSCHGDSGGPLINDRGELCGLVNWGMPCAVGKPDAHANVYFYLDWILRVTSARNKMCIAGSSYHN